MPASTAVLSPNLGLYLGRDPLTVPQRALAAGENFRIKEGRLSNINLGWQPYSALTFDGPVILIDTFNIRGVAQKQIIGTLTSLYEYDVETDTAQFLNARYVTGTVDVAAGAGPAVTRNSGAIAWVTAGIAPGDFIHFGAANYRDPTGTWFEITAVDGEQTLHVAGTPGSMTNVAYTIRRSFTGALTDVWRTVVFVSPDDGTGDDLWFATNGVDDVVSWDGSATQVVVQSALGFTCKYLAVYKNMMFYTNIVIGGDSQPTSFINSDVGKPLDVSNGLAGQFRVHDGVDHIRAVERLGDNLVFLSELTITMIQFVGDPVVFVFRDANKNVGLIGSRLVANFGDYLEFIGQDSQYLFDGVSVTEVGKQVWREVLRQRDATRHELGFHHFDLENGELIWAVCLTSDAGVGDDSEPPEHAFVEHYLEEVGDRVPSPFSKRDMPFCCAGLGVTQGVLTWDELTDTWENTALRWNDSFLFSSFPINLMGGADGTVYTINVSQAADGDALPSYVRFGRRALGDGRIRGLLTRIYPFTTQLPGELEITVRLSDHGSGPITTSVDFTFDTTLPEGGHFSPIYRRGRYFELQFGRSDGMAWQMAGYDTDTRHGGRR